MEEREWMRERALEMDSHQECIGSSAVDAAPFPATAPGGFGVGVMEEVEEEDGEFATWLWWKSMRSEFDFDFPLAITSESLSPVHPTPHKALELGGGAGKERFEKWTREGNFI